VSDLGGKIPFSGERFLPGAFGKRMEADHFERYRFSAAYVKGKKVLDIACGVGYGAPLLIEAGASDYTGVDLSEETILNAKRKFSSKKASFSVGDICTFRSSEKYDVITCFETIEHINGYRQALKCLFVALRPGGVLLISSPNRLITSRNARTLSDQPTNKFHTQEFTPSELTKELKQAGFEVKGSIFGQRQRWLYGNRFIQAIVRFIDFPDIFAYLSSAKVTPVKHLTPRYFLLVAQQS